MHTLSLWGRPSHSHPSLNVCPHDSFLPLCNFLTPLNTAELSWFSTVADLKALRFSYLYWGVSVEHVLQAEVTAMVEVIPAELLHQLEVVQTVSQRHGLLQADVCTVKEMGGANCKRTHARRRNSKAQTGKQRVKIVFNPNCSSLQKSRGF